MNKEVIYLEPEDDITDILTKLQQAEQKLVALVPPKKATMLRSAVNMKLVARVAKECEKVVVIVTADPAIVKMAMSAKIPVAKTLQSRPVVPTEASFKEAEQHEDVIDEDLLESGKPAKPSKVDPKSKDLKDISNSDIEDISLDDNASDKSLSKKPEKVKKSKTPKDPQNLNFFQKYQKWIMIGSAAAVILAVFLVWAFVFAPAVQITVAISSTPNNFSENVRFTTDENAQNLEEGILYAEHLTLDKTYKTDIAATGEEDRGDKASGRVTATVSFKPADYMGMGGYGVSINVGDRFTNNANGLTYIATSGLSNTWDGEEATVSCDNGNLSSGSGFRRTCQLSVTVSVEAEKGGTEYNVNAGSSWAPFDAGKVVVSNGSPISGGTTNVVKVISENDINKVKEAQLAEHTVEGKEDILSDIGKDMVPIEASFKNEVTDVKTTPAQSEEVKEDDQPTAELKITNSIYAIKTSTIDEYVKMKLSLADDQKIYSFGEPYFERFTGIENEARLKTTAETGPTVTEEDILEKVKGMKTGQVAAALRSINGVSSVNITTSYFWVWSVPNDPNKVTINLEVEDK